MNTSRDSYSDTDRFAQHPVIFLTSCLSLCWLILCLLYQPTSILFAAQRSIINPSFLVIALGMLVSFAGMYLLRRHFSDLPKMLRIAVTACALCLAGSVLLTVDAFLNIPFSLIGWLLAGIGSGLYITYWMTLFSMLNAREAITLIGVSLCLGLILVPLFNTAEVFIYHTALIIIPILNVLGCKVSARSLLVDNTKQISLAKCKESFDSFNYLIVSIGLIIAAFSFIASSLIMSGFYSYSVIGLIVICLLSSLLATALTFTATYRNLTTSSFYVKVSLPLAVIAFLVLDLTTNSIYGITLLVFDVALLGNLFILLFARVVSLYELPSVSAHCAFGSSICLGIIVGMLAACLFRLTDFATTIDIPTFGLLSLSVLALVSVFCLSGKSPFNAIRHLDDTNDSPGEGKWKKTCAHIAEKYALSPRETEIFNLLAKGRNSEYISTTLIISRYTAKTHINNIYKKLTIHSQSELLDLVDKEKSNV